MQPCGLDSQSETCARDTPGASNMFLCFAFAFVYMHDALEDTSKQKLTER